MIATITLLAALVAAAHRAPAVALILSTIIIPGAILAAGIALGAIQP